MSIHNNETDAAIFTAIDRINASNDHIAVSVLSHAGAIDFAHDVLYYVIIEYAGFNGEGEGIRLFVVVFASYPASALETVERIEQVEVTDKVKLSGHGCDDEIAFLHGDISSLINRSFSDRECLFNLCRLEPRALAGG